MVSLEESGRLLVLDDRDKFYSSLVDLFFFKDRKVLIPKVIDAVVLIESEGKNYVASFDGKWVITEIGNLEPLGLVLSIPLNYSLPTVLCKGVYCPQIKVLVDRDSYLVYPCCLSPTILIRADSEKDSLYYAFFPDKGWVKL